MIMVILDGFAYRIRQDGMVESAEIHKPVNKLGLLVPDPKISEFWEVRRPELTRITDGEAWYLRDALKTLSLHFPANRKPPEQRVELVEPVMSGSDPR